MIVIYILLIHTNLIFVNAAPGLPYVSREMVTVAKHEGLDCEGAFTLKPVAIDKRCLSFPSIHDGEIGTSMLIDCSGYRQIFNNQLHCYGSTTEPVFVGDTCFNFPDASPAYSTKFSCEVVLQPIRLVVFQSVPDCLSQKIFEVYILQNECKIIANYENGLLEMGYMAMKVVFNMDTYSVDVFFYPYSSCEDEPAFVFDYGSVLDGRCASPLIDIPLVDGGGLNEENNNTTRRRLDDPELYPIMVQLFDGSVDESGVSFSTQTLCDTTSSPVSGSLNKNGPDMFVYVLYIFLIVLFIL